MKTTLRITSLFLVLVMILLAAAYFPVYADSGADGFTQIIQGYQISLIFEKPAVVGENPIHVQILDSAGMPVSDADVQVSLVNNGTAHDENGHGVNQTGEMSEVSESSIDTHAAPADSHETTTSMDEGMENAHAADADTHDAMTGMSDTQEDAHAAPADSHSGMSGMSGAPADAHAASSGSHDETTAVSGESENLHGEPQAAHEDMLMMKFEEGHESGEYAGEIIFESAGDWIIRLHLTLLGEFIEVDFPLSIASSRNSSGILATFFAVNTMIILAAILLKPKSKTNPALSSLEV